MKHCCANLLSLDVNYYEQIDGKKLALLAAACPLLQSVSLNADDCDFQLHPIDEGILALGEHCHQLEHLDMYDRILQDPTKAAIRHHVRYTAFLAAVFIIPKRECIYTSE